MNRKKIFFLAVCIKLILIIASCQNYPPISKYELVSPDERLRVELSLNDLGQYSYSVLLDGNIVINQSKLGIQRNDGDFSSGLKPHEFLGPKPIIQNYNLITGKNTEIREEGQEYSISALNDDHLTLVIDFQLYNDGFAFRYRFPEAKYDNIIVLEDKTEIRFARSGKGWLQPYDIPTKWGPAYENYFLNEVKLYEIPDSAAGWSFPALFQFDDQWVHITDGGINGDYVGMHLEADSSKSSYIMRWPEIEEANGMYGNLPYGKAPWQTSWKVFTISDDLNTIINSNLVTHISLPSKYDNLSWIQPGIASWSWLSDHDSPKDFHTLKKYVNLSIDMGWKFSLVDANWDLMSNGDLEKLAAYANEKDIGLIVWYNSGGPHNSVEERPRNIMNDSDRRKKEFEWLANLGVKGVKIDFFQSDKQPIMTLYKDILEDAAKHKIMVNFHGCGIPRGWARTYPHLMTMEGVRGAECYSFDKDYPKNAAKHNTILPFTRNVLGSMDYTPVLFENNVYPNLTTSAHELALSIVFESGWLHMGGSEKGFRSVSPFVQKFLSDIPVVWHETKYLKGYPGKDVILARRNGKEWYIGGINGENFEKQFELDLSFIDQNLDFEVISDGLHGREFSRKLVQKSFMINVLPNGGFVAKSIPIISENQIN